MNARNLLRGAFLLSILSLGTFGIYSHDQAIDHARESAYAHELRQLKVFDARLNEQLLKARSGLVGHYDALASNVVELRLALSHLRQTPRFLDTVSVGELGSRLDVLTALLARKQATLERFKTHHAVLRNSRSAVGIAARPLLVRKGPEQLQQRVSAVLAELPAQVSQGPASRGAELESAIGALRNLARHVDGEGDAEVETFLRHASIVSQRQPLVDELVRKTLALPLGKSASLLEDAYSRHYREALRAETRREQVLFALALAVVALGLSDALYRVRQGAKALERATAALMSANRALAVEREKERQLGDMKTRFVSMTSHEFRNPLSAMLSSCELLVSYGERWDGERRLEHLNRIRHAARTMSQLLDEILLIGRAEAGTLRPTPAPLNLEEQCNELVEALTRGPAQERRIRRSLRGDPNVMLDERLLRHILWNLLENALKYSEPGSDVELDIDASPTQVRFTVRDAGIGIPVDDRPLLFTSFYRGGNVGKRGGSGLGLAVVKRVVDAQSGRIELKSELGRGTEFVVFLPNDVQPVAEPTGA